MQKEEKWIHITGNANYKYKRSGIDIVNTFLFYKTKNRKGWELLYNRKLNRERGKGYENISGNQS